MAMLLVGSISMMLLMKVKRRERRELENVFQERKGGPMQIMSSLISKWLPSLSTKIDINDDDKNQYRSFN